LAGLTIAAIAPAHADTVTVAVDNPGGSRAVYVEDLKGASLTELRFGASRSQPFRVRVVDTNMDRSGFTVSATMTNLYKGTSTSALDYATKITSDQLAISYLSDPLNVLNAQAVVAPLINLAGTVTGPACTTLTAAGASCVISIADVAAKLQSVSLPVDLSALPKLPLVPQVGETGAFTTPDYAGVGAADPAKPAIIPTATSLAVIKGLSVDTAPVIAGVQTALNTVLVGANVNSLFESGTLTAALRGEIGPIYDTLPSSTIDAIIAALTATASAVTPSMLKAQAGTYLGFPTLNVTVPEAASKGSYFGTLVVTAIQS
jgi:hypothetical protein